MGRKLRIATSSYHVGHAVAPSVAREKGFFREEGFDDFELLTEGLIPSFIEKEALSTAMKERGIDIVLGGKIPSVLAANGRGEDLTIVCGWRFVPQSGWYARPEIKSFGDMKGKKIGVRDLGGGPARLLTNELAKAGVDPEKDVVWASDRIFAYHRTRDHVDALMSGKVDCTQSSPPFSEELLRRGYTLLLDPRKLYPHGKPMAVVAARQAVIEERGRELRAFLRAILRAFWVMRDQPGNFSYVADLERRLRAASPNEDEQALRMFIVPEALETMPLPLDGQVPIEGLKEIGAEMKGEGELPVDFQVERALCDDAVKDAFGELRSRKALEAQWRRVARIIEKHGY